MRTIQRVGDQIKRIDDGGIPDTGQDQYFVDEAGSAAIVGGRLYINGQPARPGVHPIGVAGKVHIEVLPNGRARRVVQQEKGRA